jgi:hypothetical protein
MSTITAFQSRHIALLCKCTGTSFISGAVNNGFFDSHLRSLITAGIGVLLFVMGTFVDQYLSSHGDAPSEPMWDTLILSIVLSLGIGFFTGALQHYPFPNTQISSWVIPLGFLLTMGALAWQFNESVVLIKPIVYYAFIATLLAALTSFTVTRWFDKHLPLQTPQAHITETASTLSDDAFLYDYQEMRRKAKHRLEYSNDAHTKAVARRILTAP